MKLEFELKRSYGRERFYPTNLKAQAIVELTGRQCLKREELEMLERNGFIIAVSEG